MKNQCDPAAGCKNLQNNLHENISEHQNPLYSRTKLTGNTCATLHKNLLWCCKRGDKPIDCKNIKKIRMDYK